MQLSAKEIEYLFSFTKKKLVHWYDLQVELVDHLAARIEEEMEADPKLSFENALEKVYKGFGIFGFAKIVQQKQEQLARSARKMWWTAMHDFFKWPKFIQLVLLSGILWQLANIFDTRTLMVVFVILYIATSWVLLFRINKTRKAKQNLLMLQFGPTHISTTVFFYEMFIILSDLNFSPLVFTILATVGILIKIVSFQLYFKVKEEAIRMYPEAFA